MTDKCRRNLPVIRVFGGLTNGPFKQVLRISVGGQEFNGIASHLCFASQAIGLRRWSWARKSVFWMARLFESLKWPRESVSVSAAIIEDLVGDAGKLDGSCDTMRFG